jgi:hypothetical protein
MKSFAGIIIILFLFIIGCSKREEHREINDGLVGNWKLAELFWSPGGQGSWHPVEAPDQFTINFGADGKLSYSTNFFGAISQFNRYSLAGDTIFVSSTRNNKTDEWRYSFDGSDLIINFNVRVVCSEGCASRFIAVK